MPVGSQGSERRKCVGAGSGPENFPSSQYSFDQGLHAHFAGGRKCFIVKARSLLAVTLGIAIQQYLGIVRLRPGQLEPELAFTTKHP
jgi:hypothetical protein